jgi:hypothetical protein
MKLREIRFDPDKSTDDDDVVACVVVELSAKEAFYLAKLTHDLPGTKAEEVFPDGAYVNSAISDCLVAGVFKRVYDDLESAEREILS